MVFPAQAVRCVLDGVSPKPQHGSKFAKKWANEIVTRLKKTCGKNGTVFVERRDYGEVGKIPPSQELTFHVTL